MLWYKIIVLVCIFLFCSSSYAEIQINEIYPAPSQGEFEWVELINTSDTVLKLSEYSLIDATGKKIALPDTFIGSTDIVIATSSSILNNSDETITLLKGTSPIESLTYSETFDSTKSHVRCGSKWIITTYITKGRINSDACVIITPTSTPSPVPEPSSTPTPLPDTISKTDIELSEFFPYPESGGQEWIELLNAKNTTITLKNWYIDDGATSGSRPIQFSLEIAANSYGVVELPSSLLNNTSDTIRILNPNQEEVVSYTYSGGKKGYSFGKNNSQFCLQIPSKNTANNACSTVSTESLNPGDDTNEQYTNATTDTSPVLHKQTTALSLYQHLPVMSYLDNHEYSLTVLPSQVPKTNLFFQRLFAITSFIFSLTTISLLFARSRVRYTIL